MTEYLIQDTSLTALADEIRELSGTTTPKSLDAMTSDVDAANTEIAEQAELLNQIATALEGKASGSGGVVLPTLSNPASTSDILKGKEAINGSGNKITGTIETKTSNNLTASGATVTVPAGYYASQVTKSVATATQATPSVSINSSGLITASATQTAGYVSAGTKSGTKQLTTQAAKTVTPTTSEQTAVASGVYTTGAIKVGAIPSTYENVATETSDYTTKLASLGAAITALETELAGKASGGSGGGAGMETCTITITGTGSGTGVVTRLVNGELIVEANIMEGTTENVVCGTGIFIQGAYLGATVSDGVIVYCGSGFCYQAPKTAGVNATITLEPD